MHIRSLHVVVSTALCCTVMSLSLALAGFLYERHADQQAETQSMLVLIKARGELSERLGDAPAPRIRERLKELGKESDTELHLRMPDGTVLGSAASPAAPPKELKRRLSAPVGGTGAQGMPPQRLRVRGSGASGPEVWATWWSGKSGWSALWATRTSEGPRNSVLTVWGVLLIAWPFCLGLCVLPVLAMRHRTRAASRRLGETLRALSRGEFHARVEPLAAGHELNQLGYRTNELADSVQTTLERHRTFLADVAHQLRNPMVALRLRVENLRPYLPDTAVERQARILSDVDRLHRTLTDMLEHARSMPSDHTAQVVNVCEVVEECVRGWASVAEQNCVQLKVSMPRQAWALSRSGAVEQALHVLLDNALKFSPENSAIRINVLTDNKLLTVQVHDEGPGLTGRKPGEGPRGGVNGTTAKSGGGIGLSIARKLIESSGGRLNLSPGVPTGLLAELHLLGAVPTPDPDSADTTPPPTSGAPQADLVAGARTSPGTPSAEGAQR
ncbi:sensor histidine kinase [Streptomyces sp. NPDC029674]|uniref:sensor histidine kinase n=1 Tax=Streptomyces sp. NPDC029674 TaxID=3365297 RepID=UPI00384EBA81